MKQKIKFKIPIIVIILLAIACEIVSFISSKGGKPHFYIGWKYIQNYLIDLLPFVLFLICITASLKERDVIVFFCMGIYWSMFDGDYFSSYSLPWERFIVLILHAVSIVLLILNYAGSFSSPKVKKYTRIVGLILGSATFLYNIIWNFVAGPAFWKMEIDFLISQNYPVEVNEIRWISSWLSEKLLYIALFLFILFNNSPKNKDIIIEKNYPIQSFDYSLETELQILTDKFDLGIISEEEYKRQRMELIKKI